MQTEHVILLNAQGVPTGTLEKYAAHTADTLLHLAFSSWLFNAKGQLLVTRRALREGANKRGNSSRLTQSFHFFMFEPIFSPVNALNQPI